MSTALSYLMAIIKDIGYKDIFDILIVTYGMYLALKFLAGSRAFNLLKGIFILVVLFVVAKDLNLSTVTWVLYNLLPSGVVALVIIFQPEIRRAFEDIGKGSFLSNERKVTTDDFLESQAQEIAKAVGKLSDKHTGALIVIEQEIGLKEMKDSGVKLEAEISEELIGAIFWPFNPLHDGAAVIKDNKISAASCYLPTVSNHQEVSRELGSRHRAAISASEQTDAMIIVVSEETGTISIAKGGRLYREIPVEKLQKHVLQALKKVNEKNKAPLSKWRFSWK